MPNGQQRRWALIVHGGAKPIKDEERAENREGCLEALAAGRAVLERGGSAVDAVEAAIRVLEALPAFNAGYGSALRTDGSVEMCAALMAGDDLSVGAVMALSGALAPLVFGSGWGTANPLTFSFTSTGPDSPA